MESKGVYLYPPVLFAQVDIGVYLRGKYRIISEMALHLADI
jgi:hypothetical protein